MACTSSPITSWRGAGRSTLSLPYFIPLPPPFLFGTFGAFISIREPFPDKKALFDIGAAGPLAGFAASIPVALAGLYLSSHAAVALPANYCGPTILGVSYGSLVLGVPLFWQALSLFFPSSILNLHPLALAGWVGIFVTAINLLPAGQLDGGHVFRALFGDRVRFVSYAAVILLFGLGLFYTGWLFFGILILLLGVRHPPPLNDVSPLDTKRYLVGAFVVVVLITGFAIVPIATPPGTVSIEMVSINYPAPTMSHPVLASVNYTIANGDPVRHGYLIDAWVSNVSERVGNTTVYLTGSAFSAWAANSTWTFVLPGGTNVTLPGRHGQPPGSGLRDDRRLGFPRPRTRVREHGLGDLGGHGDRREPVVPPVRWRVHDHVVHDRAALGLPSGTPGTPASNSGAPARGRRGGGATGAPEGRRLPVQRPRQTRRGAADPPSGEGCELRGSRPPLRQVLEARPYGGSVRSASNGPSEPGNSTSPESPTTRCSAVTRRWVKFRLAPWTIAAS